MKKQLLFIFLSLITFKAISQCRDSLAGTFIEVDSCTNPTTNTVIVSVTPHASDPDMIVISPFGTFVPPWSAVNVTVDCGFNSLNMPTHYDGFFMINGSGYFSADYQNLTINYNVSWGSGSFSCRANISRQTTNIEGVTNDQILINPNPTSDILQISSNQNLEDCSLLVFSTTGKKVIETAFSNQVNVENLPVGIYIVEIRARNFIKRNFFIKQ